MPRVLAEVAGNAGAARDLLRRSSCEPRRRVLETVLRRAVARGEVRDDVDLELAIDLLAGPVIYRMHHHAAATSTSSPSGRCACSTRR